MEYHLFFRSMPVVRYAHRFESKSYELEHAICPGLIEIAYTLQGEHQAGVENSPLETIPTDSVLIEFFDRPNTHICREYFQHVAIGFSADVEYLESGGIILPRLLTFDNPINPIRPLMEEMVLHYSSDPSSPLVVANLLELIGKISAIAQTRPNKEPAFGKKWYVYRAKKYITEHLGSAIHVADVAEHLSISEWYLSHIFREVEDMTVLTYVNTLRIQKIEELIMLEGLDVRQAGRRVGLTDTNYIRRLFRQLRGYSIKELRNTRKKKL